MFVPIFGLFLVLIAPGASIGLKRGSDGPRGSSGSRGSSSSGVRRSSGLQSVDLESKIEGFLKVLRKDNDEVLDLAEKLLKETQVAKILQLTKDLSKEFGIVKSASNPYLDSIPAWDHSLSHTDALVMNNLDALTLGQSVGLLHIPSLSAVEASAGLSSGSSRVVTNALADSNHTVEQIWHDNNNPWGDDPDGSPNSRKLELKPETHEDLIKRLGGLAKAYADALSKTVQLIPLSILDDNEDLNSRRFPVGKAYKDFAVALVEVVPPTFLHDGKLKALAALGIRIIDRL